MTIESKLAKHSLKILIIAIILYIVVFVGISYIKLDLHEYNALDLAIYNQVFWNSAQGDLFGMTIHPHSYIGDHFEPLMLLLLPIYMLFQSPFTLLILQTIFIALTAWPLYRIAKNHLGKSIAVLIALFFLLNPFVQNANAFEFHILPFAMFFLAWAAVFYIKKKFLPFMIAGFISCYVREDVSLVILLFGILALVDRKSLKWILTPLALGSIWFVGALTLISRANPDGAYKFFAYYPALNEGGLNIIGFIANAGDALFTGLFSIGTLILLVALLVPFLALPLLAPRMLIPAGLIALQLFLTGFTELVLKTHYSVLLLPFLFIATIFGIQKVKDHPPSFLKQVPKRTALVVGILSITTLYGTLTFGPLIPSIGILSSYNDKQSQRIEMNMLIDSVKETDAVVASFAPLTELSARKKAYSLHYAFLGTRQYSDVPFEIEENIDTLIIDHNDFLIYHLQSFGITPYSNAKKDGPSRVRKLLDDQHLSPTYVYDNYVVYERNAREIGSLASEVSTLPQNLLEYPSVHSGNLLFLGWQTFPAEETFVAASFFWQATGPISENYQLLFRLADENYTIVHEKIYPFAYGLYPTSELSTMGLLQTSHWFEIPEGIHPAHAELQVIDIEGYMSLNGIRTAEEVITSQTNIGDPIRLF